jgi:hypothetical protein
LTIVAACLSSRPLNLALNKGGGGQSEVGNLLSVSQAVVELEVDSIYRGGVGAESSRKALFIEDKGSWQSNRSPNGKQGLLPARQPHL